MPELYKIQLHDVSQTHNLFPSLCVDDLVLVSGTTYSSVTVPLVGANGLDPSVIPDDYIGDVVMVLAVQDAAPTTCVANDKYLNKTDKKIYTATGTNTWGTTGVAAKKHTIYVDKTHNNTWIYGSTQIVEISPQITKVTRTSGTATNAVLTEKGVRDSIDAASFPQNWKPEEHIAGSDLGVLCVQANYIHLNSSNVLTADIVPETASGYDFSGGNAGKYITVSVLQRYLLGGESGAGHEYAVTGVLQSKQLKLQNGTGITGLANGGNNISLYQWTTGGWGLHYTVLT